MTPESKEWRYRYEERLGILSEGGEVTTEMLLLARKEADQWLKQRQEIEHKKPNDNRNLSQC